MDYDEYAASVLAIVKRVGWAVQGVFAASADDPHVQFTYTVGLALYGDHGHPELLLTSLPIETATVVLNILGKRVKAGERFTHGQIVSDALVGYDVCLVEVPDPLAAEMNVAHVLHPAFDDEPMTALQVVWPDKDGNFPWQSEFSVGGTQPWFGTPTDEQMTRNGKQRKVTP